MAPPQKQASAMPSFQNNMFNGMPSATDFIAVKNTAELNEGRRRSRR
jgi:hypothetical protein